MLLSVNDVRERVLDIMKVRRGKKTDTALNLEFHKHIGLAPIDVADLWYDLCYYDSNLLSAKDKSEKGFVRFLAAIYWLWARPKNASILASRFGTCVDYCQGKCLWFWIDAAQQDPAEGGGPDHLVEVLHPSAEQDT